MAIPLQMCIREDGHRRRPLPHSLNVRKSKEDSAMGKTVENPKRFIISCRVDDKEMELLQIMADKAGVNISTLLRRSIDVLQDNICMHDQPLSA